MNVNIDTELLIMDVELRPTLWGPSREDYRTRDLRTRAWQEILFLTLKKWTEKPKENGVSYTKSFI
jgi:hypothetical protein